MGDEKNKKGRVKSLVGISKRGDWQYQIQYTLYNRTVNYSNRTFIIKTLLIINYKEQIPVCMNTISLPMH